MKNIIACSLWGSSKRYLDGVLDKAASINRYYPGWTLRIYYDETVPVPIVDFLQDKAELVLCEPNEDYSGLFWRLRALWDTEAGYVALRDVEMPFTQLEKTCTQAWLTSGKRTHILRFNPSNCVQILGGYWGMIAGTVPDMETLVSAWLSSWNLKANASSLARYMHPFSLKGLYYRSDQLFLASEIYPLIVADHIAHVASDYTYLRYAENSGYPGQETEIPLGEIFQYQADIRRGSSK